MADRSLAELFQLHPNRQLQQIEEFAQKLRDLRQHLQNPSSLPKGVSLGSVLKESGIVGEDDYDKQIQAKLDGITATCAQWAKNYDVRADPFQFLVREITRNPLEEPTRNAKRNLNVTWSAILFVGTAYHFDWPQNVPLLGFSFPYSAGLILGLMALLSYQAFQFSTYRRSDLTVWEANWSLMQRLIREADDAILTIFAHAPWIDAADGQAWIERASSDLKRADKESNPAAMRALLEFHFPLAGFWITMATLAFALWGASTPPAASCCSCAPASESSQR